MHYLTNETLQKELIPLLKTNEIYLSPYSLVLFCYACYQGPKPIPTIQENNQFLTNLLPTIQNQLPEKEFQTIFLANQNKPTSWNNVREVWIDPKYQGGCFFCRFCVPLRTHPDYRKFYLFDNRFFYLDKKWEQAAWKYWEWEQEYHKKQNIHA